MLVPKAPDWRESQNQSVPAWQVELQNLEPSCPLPHSCTPTLPLCFRGCPPPLGASFFIYSPIPILNLFWDFLNQEFHNFLPSPYPQPRVQSWLKALSP